MIANLSQPSTNQPELLHDYRLAVRSRETSIATRREVLNGRAKFGAGGAGKELAQVAMARVFQRGDWRSGYYRDQTLMMALGVLTVQQFFAQIYAHADVSAEPVAGGRQMVTHFGTRVLDDNGAWLDQTQRYNSAPDSSPTASQMPRLVGLAYASRLYRTLGVPPQQANFSVNGNEVAFGTIGNGSTAEGQFWESINAVGLLESPAVISIFDDGYGISVPNKYQMIKGDLSALLAGFQRSETSNGFDLYTVRGWEYTALVEVYRAAADRARRDHIPALIHVTEMTQPLGHSTSGSHERYKSAERMAFEQEFDPLRKMRLWMLENELADQHTLDTIEEQEKAHVLDQQRAAWRAFVTSVEGDRQHVQQLIEAVAAESRLDAPELTSGLYTMKFPRRRDLMEAVQKTLLKTAARPSAARDRLRAWRNEIRPKYQPLFSSHLISQSAESPLNVAPLAPHYAPNAPELPAFELLNRYFGHLIARDLRVVTFGEDTGHLGGVNQTMAGLQAEFGKLRVSDTGIREMTILGQAIGLAMRGFRPIAEMQYLDYLHYALQTLSDDLATLHWRSHGGHKAPVIVRTRGHRLEGVWHSGSPMGGILHLVRGVHVCVPRNATQAIGFYNTLLQGDDPALVIEVLNGYRLKERLPSNLNTYSVPLGVPETLREGSDITIVTYGPLCRIALAAAEQLAAVDISAELIDVQTLLPFDRRATIVRSLQKTNRLLVLDEDVPGGASAFIMQQILEVQGGYHWLDSQPTTLCATEHRPAFGADGNYFSKPNVEDIFATVYDLMNEANPQKYPNVF